MSAAHRPAWTYTQTEQDAMSMTRWLAWRAALEAESKPATKCTALLRQALLALESCGAGAVEDGGQQWFDTKLVDEAHEAIERHLATWPEATAAESTGGAAMVLAPHFRGYADLGTGNYVLNHSGDAPAELIVSVATEAEKAGRTVGDLQDNAPDALLQPDAMAVRIRFSNVAGLDALEQQLRLLREAHFATT